MFISRLLYSIAIPLFFFLDCATAHYFNDPWLYSLLGFTLLLVFIKSPWKDYLLPLFLLSVESTLFHDRFGLTLIVIFPVLILGWWIEKYLHSRILGLLICYSFALFLFFHTFPLYVLKQDLPPLYTFSQIGANLTLLYFSLKWFPTVKRGNRF